MKITRFHIFQFSCPLTDVSKPYQHLNNHREGLIIQLCNDNDVCGFGEISPLPGLSRETLADCIKEVTKLKAKVVNAIFPAHLERLGGGFETCFKKDRLSPSVQFGIEMAILNLLANSRHLQLCQLLSNCHHDFPRDDIMVNGFLAGPAKNLPQQARALLAQGFSAIKMKVGGGPIQNDIDAVRSVIDTVGKNAMLRLDANQQWTLKDALVFGEAIGCASIEYVEEPFKDLSQIPEFFAKTLIPVALDESVRVNKFEDIKGIDGVDIFVLKPTLLGGIEKLWQLAEKARSVGIVTVISSSYESGIGLATLAELSACLSKHTYVGLDTQKFFKEDLIRRQFHIKHGKIDIKDAHLNASEIKTDLWKEIQV